jgi:phosphoenolpyruvate carboxylase
MQIGAQPAPGGERIGLQAVQPAAWVYAWAQSRHMLPGWYGAGTGLNKAMQERGLPLLRRCYRGWPFFHSLIDDTEAMLARADIGIAAHYDRLAAPALRFFGPQLRAEFERCVQLVLQIKECAALLDTDQTLQRAIAMRNPYIDPINLMQVELLERWRASGRQNRELFEALQASVSGMARALQLLG